MQTNLYRTGLENNPITSTTSDVLIMESDQQHVDRRERTLWLLLIFIVLAIHVYSLRSYPEPFVDDAVMASRAWEFLKSGRAFGVLDRGVFDRFEGYWTVWPVIPTLIQSMGFFLAKSPSLTAIRTVSLVSGVFLLVIIFYLASFFGGRRLGFLSVLLTGISLPFFVSSHLGRMDIFSAVAGYLAITLILYNRNSELLLALIAGLICGLALEIHPYNVIYLFVIVGLFIFMYRKDLPKKPNFWAFGVGVLLAAAIYLLLHVVRFPYSFFEIMRLADSGVHRPPILTFDALIILQSVMSAFASIAMDNIFILPFLLMALIKVDVGRSPRLRMLALMNLIMVAAYSLIIRNKIGYYAILVSPPLTIFAGSCILQLREKKVSRNLEIFRRIFFGGLLAAVLLLTLIILRQNSWATYLDVQERINTYVRPGDRVMGNQLYWFGLHDHNYYSWEELIYYQRFNPKSNLEMAFLEFKPDLFIIDHQIDQYISDDAEQSGYLKVLNLSKKQITNILESYGSLVDQFDGSTYGTVRIYRFNWEKVVPPTSGSE